MGARNRFRLNLNLVYRLLEVIPTGGATPSAIRECFPELGGEKVRSIREWADNLGLTYRGIDARRDFVTALGRAALQTRGSGGEAKLHEILYYKLCTCRDLEVLGSLVNLGMFEVSRRVDPTFDLAEIKSRMLAIEMTTRAAPKYVQGEVSTALSALTSEEALGRLRIVVPVDKSRYRVNTYRPDWRCAAYMLYDSWPENLSRMKIDEVVNAHNSLGRIFYMTEPQVMILLSKLEQERIIALEVIADLKQIGLNPALKAQDFLEMLVNGHE